MPVIRASEQTADPFPLLDGLRYGIGWQYPAGQRGEPVFVALAKGTFGAPKVVERFPLTQDGWATAWGWVARRDPDAARRLRSQLAERHREDDRWRGLDPRDPGPEVAELESRSLARLRDAPLLGGYAPGTTLVVGERYDARFLEDRLAVFPAYGWEARAEVPYAQIEDVEIGGPGLVKSGGGFTGGGLGTVAALEGMAIAAILNALTTRTTITTIVRIQGTDCELFFLHTRSAPEHLRIQMSPALGAIRSARAAATQPGRATPQSSSPQSPIGDLAKLAEMLSAGLLTREEFDQLKAQLLQG